MDDEATLAELADAPLDDLDATALGQVRDLWTEVDPVPDDLVGRVLFSVALDEMYDEVARLTRVPLDALAVRSADVSMRTETLTFAADTLSAMVTVTRVGVETFRLDGWLTPPAPYDVRLRLQGATDRETRSDEGGRFSFEGLAAGAGQLSFHPAPGPDGTLDETASSVVTPVFAL